MRQEVTNAEHSDASKYAEMDAIWHEFGPISDVIYMLTTVLCCAAILVCFVRYQRSLHRYRHSKFDYNI